MLIMLRCGLVLALGERCAAFRRFGSETSCMAASHDLHWLLTHMAADRDFECQCGTKGALGIYII
jgi:hypothetical protein